MCVCVCVCVRVCVCVCVRERERERAASTERKVRNEILHTFENVLVAEEAVRGDRLHVLGEADGGWFPLLVAHLPRAKA